MYVRNGFNFYFNKRFSKSLTTVDMVLTFTLTGLFILLIVILGASYYFNQEGFAEMDKKKENFEDQKKEEKKEKKEGFADLVADDKEEDDLLSMEGFANIAPVAPSGLTTAAAPANMGPTQQVPTTTSSPAPARIRPPVSPTQVEVTDQGYASMEKNQRSALLRDIQKVVRNEIIANRSTEHVKKGCDMGDDCDEDDGSSDSTAQGRDYKKNSFKKEDSCATGGSCGPLTDMTKYIRKDEIPCWGCNIDY